MVLGSATSGPSKMMEIAGGLDRTNAGSDSGRGVPEPYPRPLKIETAVEPGQKALKTTAGTAGRVSGNPLALARLEKEGGRSLKRVIGLEARR